MLPLSDSNRSNSVAVWTYLLIAVNTLVFLWTQMLGSPNDLFGFYSRYSVVPATVSANLFTLDSFFDLFRSMFFHGSWGHLLGNMLYLFIFGDNVEDRLGKLFFPVFYVICGFAASLAQIAIAPQSRVPLIGASGAIAGVLGCYLVFYPRTRVNTLVFLGIFIRIVRLPSMLVLGFWFLLQVVNGLSTTNVPADSGGVAFWAHMGGFVMGAFIGWLFRDTPYQPGPKRYLSRLAEEDRTPRIFSDY